MSKLPTYNISLRSFPYLWLIKLGDFFRSFRSIINVLQQIVRFDYATIWNANAFGKWRNYNDPNSLPPSVTIQGTLEEWQSWGSDENGKPKRWPAGRFKQKTIDVAVKEISELYPKTLIIVTTMKHGTCYWLYIRYTFDKYTLEYYFKRTGREIHSLDQFF